LNRIELPGKNVQEFTLAIVFHGVEVDNQLLESLPDE
jgi:hypothetical protein